MSPSATLSISIENMCALKEHEWHPIQVKGYSWIQTKRCRISSISFSLKCLWSYTLSTTSVAEYARYIVTMTITASSTRSVYLGCLHTRLCPCLHSVSNAALPVSVCVVWALHGSSPLDVAGYVMDAKLTSQHPEIDALTAHETWA